MSTAAAEISNERLLRRLRRGPYGSKKLLRMVDLACDRIEAGELDASLVDDILANRYSDELLRLKELESRPELPWWKLRGEPDPNPPPPPPPPIVPFTVQELKEMGLKDVMSQLEKVNPAEIDEAIDQIKAEMADAIAGFKARIKGLNQIKALKGLPIRKKKGKPAKVA